MIPDDIRKAAEAVLDEINSDDMHVIPIAPIIARALMNERERCARIVDDARFSAHVDLRSLAAAIRRGDNPDV